MMSRDDNCQGFFFLGNAVLYVHDIPLNSINASIVWFSA
jgi:hypothetical protein